MFQIRDLQVSEPRQWYTELQDFHYDSLFGLAGRKGFRNFSNGSICVTSPAVEEGKQNINVSPSTRTDPSGY